MIKITDINLYTGEELIRDAALLISGTDIVYAGKKENLPHEGENLFLGGENLLLGGEDYKITRSIKGGGALCLPGLVNAHTHGAMVFLRGVASDRTLSDWLEKVVPIEEKFTRSMIYDGTMLAIAQMIATGTTAFADMYYHMDAVIDSVLETGIRANITRGSSSEEGVDSHKGWFADWDGAGEGRLRVFVGLHAEYTSDEKTVAYAVETAGKLSTGIHLHISESLFEVEGCIGRRGCSPVEYFKKYGIFNNHTLAAHCVHLSDNDIAILGEAGVYAAHCPVSNMKLANGIAPLRKMEAAGVNIALGTDGASSNNSLDMFREMKAASLLQKGSLGDPKAMDAEKTIKAATLTGAKALGFDKTGLLKKGYRADLILIDPDSLNMFPGVDPAADAVYSAQGSDVTLNMVNGKILYEKGEYKTLDIEKVKAQALQTARELNIV